MGSSGNSTGPHLHLEVYDALGNLIEPFAGPCNNLSNRSWWLEQRPYYDSAVNRLMVGDAPVTYLDCPGRTVTNEEVDLLMVTHVLLPLGLRGVPQARVVLRLVPRHQSDPYRAAVWEYTRTPPHVRRVSV